MLGQAGLSAEDLRRQVETAAKSTAPGTPAVTPARTEAPPAQRATQGEVKKAPEQVSPPQYQPDTAESDAMFDALEAEVERKQQAARRARESN